LLPCGGKHNQHVCHAKELLVYLLILAPERRFGRKGVEMNDGFLLQQFCHPHEWQFPASRWWFTQVNMYDVVERQQRKVFRKTLCEVSQFGRRSLVPVRLYPTAVEQFPLPAPFVCLDDRRYAATRLPARGYNQYFLLQLITS